MAQRFEQIAGQTEVRDLLLRAVKNNHVSHALHFLGPEGSGNLSLALAFAGYVFCENPGETDACGQCPSCVKMASLQHPDLHFVFPVIQPTKNKSVEAFMREWREILLANPLLNITDWMQTIADPDKQGIISVDLAQEIQQKISMKAFSGGYRIAIIWMPEMMRPPAANKLLKVIEEPPEKTLFLLVGNSTDELLPTILSRVQTVRVPRLQNDLMEQLLVDRHGIEPQKARSAALLSDGNMNMALKLVSDGGNHTAHFEIFRDWFRACYRQSEGLKRVELSDRFSDLKREGQKSFLTYSLQMLRQCMLVSVSAEHLLLVDGDERKLALNLGKTLNHRQLQVMAEEINQGIYHISRNAAPRPLFLDLSVQIKNLFHN